MVNSCPDALKTEQRRTISADAHMQRRKNIIRCGGLCAVCAMVGLLGGLCPQAGHGWRLAAAGFDGRSAKAAVNTPAVPDRTAGWQFIAAEDSDDDNEPAVRPGICGASTRTLFCTRADCRFGVSAQPPPGRTRTLQALHVRFEI